MFKKIIKLNLLLLFFGTFSIAEIISNIDVNGNKRLSNESIIVFTKVELNNDYSTNELNIIIKDLYETNFFKKINLRIENNTLIIDVLENPIIENIEIIGINNKGLLEVINKNLVLKNRNSYIESLFLSDLNFLKSFLKNNGFYFSEIKSSYLLNEDQNSIRLTYDVDLGKRARIEDVIFLGDKKIKDKKLLSVITSEPSKFWKFISKNTYLDKSRINLDKRLLKNYYKNKGYYDVVINDSFLEFQDNGYFKLIFNITAGKKHQFNKLTLKIPDNYDKTYFQTITNLLSKLEKTTYSLNEINSLLEEVDNIALSKQFEFINADMKETKISDNLVDVLITLSESEKHYVEKINIIGNQFTLEEVIRNALIVDEGDAYNEILYNKSINLIKSLNIFGSVESSVKDGSNDNLKIIEIKVEERPTGEITLGAGFGTSGGSIGGGISENNFLGKGVRLDTNLFFTKSTVKGKFVYSKPNFNYTDNTLFTSIQSTSTDVMSSAGYETNNLAFSLGTRFEQYNNLFFSPELSTTFETLKTSTAASSALKKQAGDYFDLNFNYSLDYDLRNQRYQPTDGFRNVFTQELPLISDTYDVVNSFQSTKYSQFKNDMVTRMHFFSSIVNTLSDDDVRISKRLYLPSKKLRGFENGKVGPIENSKFIGGNYIAAVNISSSLPQVLPTLEMADFSIFVDAANVWGVDYNSVLEKNNKIRSAVGINMDLNTPIGPLSFSLSQAITKASTDVTETFRFNLGTTF
jgi:outer membrane protein insertion porin family